MAIPQSGFNEYLKADWLYLYLGAAKVSVSDEDLTDDGTEQIRIPLESMNRTTGDLFYRMHFHNQGQLSRVFFDVEVTGSTRLITLRLQRLTSGIGPDVLSAVAYVPTYSYTLPDGTTVAGLTPP